MGTFINEILAANPSRNVAVGNPAVAMAFGSRAINSGFDKLQEAGQRIKQKRIDSDVASVLGTVDTTLDPSSYRDALFGAVSKVSGVSALDALGISDKLSKGRFDDREWNYDVKQDSIKNGLASSRLGVARGNLGMRQREFNKPNYVGVEKVNPYTGSKSNFIYDKNQATPKLIPLTDNEVDVGGVDRPTVALNDAGDTNTVVDAGNGSVAQAEGLNDYVSEYMTLAANDPIDASLAGSPVAGPIVAGAMPKKSVTYSEPDEWGVAMGNDGTFKDGNGNYIIPVAMRDVKEVSNGKGGTEYVVINKTTGRDAKGNAVGDTGETKWSVRTVNLPNGQSTQEAIGVTPDGKMVKRDDNGTVVDAKLDVKEPTLLQKDKQYIDSLGSITPAMNRVGKSIENSEDIFGPIASWFDRKMHDDDFMNLSGVGQLFGTNDSKEAAKFDSDTSRMMSKVIKSLGANPSDRDLRLLEAQVPQRSDEPETAMMKLESFKELFYDIQANTYKRLLKSNPSSIKNINIPDEILKRIQGSKLPQETVDNNQGSQYGADTEIISF